MRWNERIYIKDLSTRIGETHTLKGWVQFTRKSGKIRFLGFRDGSGIIQCVLVRGETEDASFDAFQNLNQETSVEITGTVRESNRSQFGVEIGVEKLEILGKSENYPITPKEHGITYLLNHRHLWLRSKKQVSIFKIRDVVIQSIREFFSNYSFTLMDSPILTTSVGEDPKGLFSTDYFDLGKAYLAQTGQLYLETSIFAHGKVFCFGPTFRAEKSKTRRHLTEFWMVEAEMAFFNNNDNMDVQEDLVRFVIEKVIEKCGWHLQTLERDLEKLKQCLSPFQRIDYTDAVEILKQKGSDVTWGDDLGATDESLLVEDSKVPIFIYNYPKKAKAFYMKENPENSETVLCADLLAPEGYGEVIGGSQREDSYEKLKQRILDEGLPLENYEWYLDLRKFGSVEHSGFGLGIERFVAWICGLPHIREVVPFPRLMERLTP
ncbi:MAG: asparaginyl-tRNA synthetase [bacterium]|jgi:asparaginyl-tRNA synthetase